MTRTLHIHTYQHPGRRAEQQDRVLALQTTTTALILVADGAGGQRNGAQAAQAISDTALRLWTNAPPAPENARPFLEHLVAESHAAIQQLDPRHDNNSPRSTLAAVLLHGPRATWVTCGDTRIYQFHQRAFLWRSKDHSIVELLKTQGQVTEDEMGTHPDQGKLYQSLGGATPPAPDYGALDLAKNHWLLLCTDGFWEHLAQSEIATLHSPLPLACLRARRQRHLIHAILHRAGATCDNITLATIRQ